MKKQTLFKTIALALILSLCFSAAGCVRIYTTPEAEATAPAADVPTVAAPAADPLPAGGTLLLKVNPQIAVSYDASGNATDVSAVNPEGAQIIENYTGYEGKECSQVINELVGRIGDAGYFVEEIEGQPRQIIIEIEAGSSLPSADFMDGIVSSVQSYVSNKQLPGQVNVQGESVYGMTDYSVTDYASLAPSAPAPTAVTITPSAPGTYGTSVYGDTLYDDIIGNTLYDDDGIAGNTLYDTDTPYDDDIQGNTLYENDGIAGNTLYDTDTPYDSNSGYSSSGNSGYSSSGNSGYSSSGNSGYSSSGNSGYSSSGNSGYSNYGGGSGYGGSGYDD